MVLFIKVKWMVMGYFYGEMGLNMMDSIRIIGNMGKENICRLRGNNIRGVGKMGLDKGKGY